MELHEWSQKLFGFTLHRHAHRHLKDHFIPHAGNNHKPYVVHHRALFLYSALLITLKITVIATPLLYPFSQAQSLSITPQNIIELTNESRVDFGLPELTSSPQLAVAALNKARDMMEKGYFAHFSPEGVSPWYWFAQADYNYSYAGENLAIRFSTAEGVTDAWLSSPAHKANIVSSSFTEIGVAVLTDGFGEEGPATLVVQMFGSPQSGHEPLKTEVSKPDVQTALAESNTVLGNGNSLKPPAILFPLDNSFVNQSTFQIITQAGEGENLQIYVDDKLYAEVLVPSDGQVEYVLPKELALEEGKHVLYASVSNDKEVSRASAHISFQVDTVAPTIYKDKFSMLPALGKTDEFDISASVSDDSIRTLVSAGSDSAALTRESGEKWAGKLTVYNISPDETKPVELFAQDIAGNENRTRVGYIERKTIAGVFSFVETESEVGSKPVSMFGGLLTFNNFDKSVQNFFLYFVVFLTFGLTLKIAIARHIQHPKTIAGTAGVIILAMILFAV